MVEHEDEVHLWFKEALVNPALLTAWHAYMAKKQKCDQVEDLLSKKALNSVSTKPVYLRWGLSKQHLPPPGDRQGHLRRQGEAQGRHHWSGPLRRVSAAREEKRP